MKGSKTRDLIYMAMYAAIFIVFDYLAETVGLFRMPQGGSLSLGVLALLFSSYHLGWKKSLGVCLVCNLLMFVTGSMNFYGSVVSLLFDYILGYCAYAFASCFKNIKWFYTGVLVTSVIRLACSTFSGVVAYDTEFWASLVYNATYMIPNIIVDMIVLPLLWPRLEKAITKK